MLTGAFDPFVHLHVASGYSLRYGASTPDALVERAGDHGQDMVALTDRDGVYGAVRFVLAAQRAGIAPILGADLAVLDDAVFGKTPTPVRGGRWVTEPENRVVFLARGRVGWASLCRLISQAHRSDITGVTFDQIAAHRDGLAVVLGPTSDVGRALAARRPDIATRRLARWREISDDVWISVVSHAAAPYRAGVASTYSTVLAARMLGHAREHHVPVVLSNAVRHADKSGGRAIDVLDAVRRGVPLDSRHRERPNNEGYLKSGAQMRRVADEIARAAGDDACRLLDDTRVLAESCAIDPGDDLGLGGVFVPEDDVVTPGASSSADAILRERCIAGLVQRGMDSLDILDRLDDELATIRTLGFASYFLTVDEVVRLIRDRRIRVAARGSGAGSLVNYALGISLVNPIEHDLVAERFLSPLRRALPDIDIDVESARRLEVYDAIMERFGEQRCASVSMMETYRVRHAIRDVGAALALPPSDIDAFAKSFPHIRARNIRTALHDLPELSTLGAQAATGELDHVLDLVEALDGLPRHIAMHPCGIVLSNLSLRDRTPIEPSGAGYPMTQFDKDDVEELGLLKLDVLGVRMQSALAYACDEIVRVTGEQVNLDAQPLTDPQTFDLIGSTRTLGCFQIESPGQRELIGKFGPENFNDIIIDISLFRPGPVKSDMVTPFLRARQGWAQASYLHEDLRPILAETYGVVVFHEQVLRIVAVMTGCSLAEADETRRSLGSPEGQADVRAWFYPAALRRGYSLDVVEEVWEVLRAFASFGFCKAHAAAFAVPTYQSAWLKTHYPAFFFAAVLTHDPGMYPKRLILDDARHFDIPILGIDVNASRADYVVESVGSRHGIRLGLADVKGISAAEIETLVSGQPYASLTDFWHRSGVSRPIIERLIACGSFDALHDIDVTRQHRQRQEITRRDLLLHLADLESHGRVGSAEQPMLALDIVSPTIVPSGLPEMTPAECVRAELDVLGLDASHHVLNFYAPMLRDLSITPARDLLSRRSRSTVFVAGVKAAVQTPPIRSGQRVIFLTLDDSTGPIDATFFEDAQASYATTVFHSWLVLVRGEVRRTGPRGISLRATGCWELGQVHDAWSTGGIAAVTDLVSAAPVVALAPRRPVLLHASGFRQSPYTDVAPAGVGRKVWHSSPGSSGW